MNISSQVSCEAAGVFLVNRLIDHFKNEEKLLSETGIDGEDMRMKNENVSHFTRMIRIGDEIRGSSGTTVSEAAILISLSIFLTQKEFLLKIIKNGMHSFDASLNCCQVASIPC
jgi:hemerythrin